MRLPRFAVHFLHRHLILNIAHATEPDEVIGPSMRWRKTRPDGQMPPKPFLKRWFVIPKNKWINIYVHCFLRDDEDRALHDHPWWNFSILLMGQYLEHTVAPGGVHMRQLFKAGDIKFRRATAAHRVELTWGKQPAWSLFITGPVVRKWGFHCPEAGWRSSTEFHNKGGCND